MRDIKIKVNDEGYVSAYEKFIGNQYEHEATRLLFELPDCYKGDNLFQYVVFTLCDGTVKIRQMVEDACVIDRDITNVTGLLLMEVVIKNIENAEDLTSGKVMNSQVISGFIKPAGYNPDNIISESIDKNVILYLDEFDALLAEIRQVDIRLSDIIDGNPSSLTEVKDARGGYALLQNRLDDMLVNINDNTNRINALASGSPLVANSISEMTDQTRVYVNITDGNWYYYNDTEWVSGGVYQSTEIGKNSVSLEKLTSDISSNIASYSKLDGIFESGVYWQVNNLSTYEKRNNSSFHTKTFNVTMGDKIRIKTYIRNTDTIYGILLFNNDVLVAVSMRGSDYDFSQPYELTIPENVNKIVVQSRITYFPYAEKLLVFDINPINEKVKTMDKKISTGTFENITSNLYIIDRYFYDVTNETFSTWDNGELAICYCEKGDKFRISSQLASNMCGVAYFDKNNILIKYEPIITTGTILENFESVAPDNTNYALFDNSSANGYISFKIEKEILENIDFNIGDLNTRLNNVKMYQSDQDFETKNLVRRCRNLEKNYEFTWDDFDKSYFAFVIDDCNSFTPTCYDTFHSLNVPLGVACIVEHLDRIYPTSNNRTIKDILDLVVNDGGEILAHYSGNLADPGTSGDYLTSDEDWKVRTRDVKKILEEQGFNVRGLILADSSKRQTNKGEEYCSKYFDYSDNVGKSNQYKLGKRKFFIGVNTLEDMKAWIDVSCQTPGFYPLCLHGNRVDEPLSTVENLTEIINYIKSKGDNVAVISTYSDVFDNFGTTILEKRLSALENR